MIISLILGRKGKKGFLVKITIKLKVNRSLGTHFKPLNQLNILIKLIYQPMIQF